MAALFAGSPCDPHATIRGRRLQVGAACRPRRASTSRTQTMTHDALVAIDHVTFGYDRRVILSDVSMVFPRGKVIAIMGGSGCGKTTLLRLIGGVLTPQQGTITFDGVPVEPARS